MPRKAQGQLIVRERKRDTSYGVRIPYGGRRHYMTLGYASEGMTERRALEEVENIVADVRRGIWKPPAPEPVVEVQAVPTLHQFASTWYADRRADGLKPRSLEALEWALGHVLEHLAAVPVNEITVDRVDAYRRAKLRERELGVVRRPLSNASINTTIAVLAAVCDAAVEAGHLPSNPARGMRRQLKTAKPPRVMLEVDEVRALLDGAGKHRALLAVMALAGLRVGEACALDWRDVDLARAQLHVRDAKTAAGVRRVDVSPDLLDTLKAWKADAARSPMTLRCSRRRPAPGGTATTSAPASCCRRSRG
jgi:integrase